ncbi:hypothetical protein ABPG75_005860 [Micractinium tetrahymenae]
MSSDFALDKLSRLNEAVAEEDRTPELRLLMEFADVSRQAEERLRAVAARRAEGAPPAELQQQPETFQGLAQFVRAVALGAEAAGVGLCSAEVLTLLKEALLQPIVQREEDGSYQAHRPSVVCPSPTPLNVLQLLASGVFLHVTGNPEPAIAMLSAALSGVWPPSRDMQRRLVARQFVPSAAAEDQPVQAAEGQRATGGGPDGQAGAAETAEGKAEEQPAPSGSRGSGDSSLAGPSGSGSGASGAGEAAPERAAAAPLAAALDAALAERCPAISLADVHKSALVLRLFLGCRAVGEQRGDGPSLQAIVRTLLMDCQQLLDLDPQCMHAYVWAAQLLLYARWPMDRARTVALFEEGVQRAQEAKCWLAAGEVAHDYAMWLVFTAAGERNVAEKQAALLEAGKLLQTVWEAERELAAWMPAGRLHQLTARRQQLAGLLRQLQSGQLGTLGAVRPASGASACDFCGQAVAQLRFCGSCKVVGYCGRECQVKAWKAGHKAVCVTAAQPAEPPQQQQHHEAATTE